MEESLLKVRHSLAHIMAQAVEREIDPNVKMGIGPAIDTGFYYDFLFSDGIQLHEEDMKTIQNQMKDIIKEKQEFKCFSVEQETAKEILQKVGQPFKIQLIEEFIANGEEITFYVNHVPYETKEKKLSKKLSQGYIHKYEELTKFLNEKLGGLEDSFVTFIDLCEGPHSETTADIDKKSFKLSSIAGAYWRGDENNEMMTRVYGYAFETEDKLKEYINFLEEAKKRDHRVLGEKLDLFTISSLVGAGLPLFKPKGTFIRNQLVNYLWDIHREKGYQWIWTPHVAKKELYDTSGHSEKFGDDIFHVKGGEGEDFILKPMNCPHHMQIFADNYFSYRDLPIRYFEPATIYRDEKSGQLGGLTRVRAITQDDGHLFCRVSQIGQEIQSIIEVIKKFYTAVGLWGDQNYWVSLSVRDKNQKEDYLGEDSVWEEAEAALRSVADEQNLNYEVVEGEAAFYGPKLDFMFFDSLKREWQLSTIQLDFNLPNRFDLHYINEEGEKEQPVVIHRAICGSLERFMGVMIEHFAGVFPLWLAPEQARIIPVSDKFNDYGEKVLKQLKEKGYRVTLDDTTNNLNKKIRNSEMERIPYMLIIGEEEENRNSVAVREYSTKNQYSQDLDEFEQFLKDNS